MRYRIGADKAKGPRGAVCVGRYVLTAYEQKPDHRESHKLYDQHNRNFGP